MSERKSEGSPSDKPRPADILEINSESRVTMDEFRWAGDGDLLITHKDIDDGEERACMAFLLRTEDVEHLRSWLNRHAAPAEVATSDHSDLARRLRAGSMLQKDAGMRNVLWLAAEALSARSAGERTVTITPSVGGAQGASDANAPIEELKNILVALTNPFSDAERVDRAVHLVRRAIAATSSTRSATLAASKLPSLPEDIQEWCWHMDTHVTEHDLRHAGLALRAAWPHVSEWLRAHVGPSDKAGVPFNAPVGPGGVRG